MGMCPLTGHRVVEPGEVGGKVHNTHQGFSASSSDDESPLPERPGVTPGNKYDQHPVVWKRTIPKRRSCEPLAFSGLISCDEHGNRLHHYNQALATRGRASERA